mmetsp:Transcript_18103/g.23814  ORF Transcript_18103/g.23814 Transcript_18103/m.23814 type:complete len:461 (-) Transcript_18103:301-1683(-)|eukprot:CAMPEP_0117755548 /NCGR_PEP_ID=MMETSP0947-20121206/13521_1 /TAXON_ID=44440 /ORGANISM="Chattonella subsalsa, Strain CCMP2191" /LENGTH=460 /DNA_ID=CAMNT_0005574911 /DNA_START=152 /DNA_END=1534 /DNA_ORIENTATION=-
MKGTKGIDFYRKIPVDLTESTALGAFFSITAIIFMIGLFFVELWAFLSSSLDTSVILDSSQDAKLRINFNITMLDVPCEFASVDVLDVLGTNRLNVSSNIERWHLNTEGERKMFMGRNKVQQDIMVEEHPYDLEELHRNGEHAIPVTKAKFAELLADKEFTFVDFYAPWCIWCQRLAPTWELFAEDMENRPELAEKVNIVKVDCVEERELCAEHNIRSFPTLRFFVGSSPHMPDFKGDRTREALMKHAHDLTKQHTNLKQLPEGQLEKRLERAYEMHNTNRAGCMLSGFLTVNRVPGNFHIEAHSKYHDLDPTMTNLSHVVNHLSFGEPLRGRQLSVLKSVPEDMKQMSPLDGNSYINDDFHQSYHHFLKVVNTNYEVTKRPVKGYQLLATSQIMHYDVNEIPEARFSYTISPMGVVIKKGSRKWYDFITSICAIIGGTFTVIGVLDAMFYRLLKGNKQF